MQSQSEKTIDQVFHTQITQRGYTVDQNNHTLTYKFDQRLNIHTVNLTQMNFFNIWPNINKFYNSFQLEINGVSFLVTIPPSLYSFWSIFDMLTIFNTQINLQITAYGTWTFSLVGNNAKFVQLTNTSSTPFKFIQSESIQFNQLFSYIGFGAQSNAFKQYKTTQISEVPYNVTVSSAVHVCCRNLTLNTEIQSCLASIPINEGILNLIQYISPFYQCNRHILSKNIPYAVTDLTLIFLDDNGFPLIVENNKISLVLMWEAYSK